MERLVIDINSRLIKLIDIVAKQQIQINDLQEDIAIIADVLERYKNLGEHWINCELEIQKQKEKEIKGKRFTNKRVTLLDESFKGLVARLNEFGVFNRKKKSEPSIKELEEIYKKEKAT